MEKGGPEECIIFSTFQKWQQNYLPTYLPTYLPFPITWTVHNTCLRKKTHMLGHLWFAGFFNSYPSLVGDHLSRERFSGGGGGGGYLEVQDT